jgi:NADH-quinone oxidoreductase subunit A
MTEPVVFVTLMLIFLAVGIGFLLVNLFVGKLVRPDRPGVEKGMIYECGEPPVGSSWIQFDLRFYVVALLFVIFDVEMAFFFPWAVVFGTSNELAKSDLTTEQRTALTQRLVQQQPKPKANEVEDFQPVNIVGGAAPEREQNINVEAPSTDPEVATNTGVAEQQQAAKQLARLAFIDVLIFFGVLLVGFAYLWKRGDLEWVRGMAGQNAPEPGEVSTGGA